MLTSPATLSPEQQITCRLCNSTDNKILLVKHFDRYGATFTLYQCRQCDLCFVGSISDSTLQKTFDKCGDPVPTAKELMRLNHKISRLKSYWGQRFLGIFKNYPNAFHDRKGFLRWCLLPIAPFVFRNIIPFRGKGRMLDIGCNNGLTLDMYRQVGWDVYGIEPREPFCAEARKRGVKAFQGILETASYDPDFFDVIRLQQVFEHLPDPDKALQIVHQILSPDGRVYIEVPNQRSVSFYVVKEKFYALPGHLFIYSPKTLRLFCEKHGFQVLQVRQRSSDGFLLAWLKSRLNRDNNKQEPALSRLLWRILELFFLKPLCGIFVFFGYGDIFEAEITKVSPR